jgi:anti-anti-sigma factor
VTADMDELPTTHEETAAVETIRLSPDVAVLVVHGQADLHTAPELREQLHGAIDDGAFHVIVDLTDASFVDSMTLGVLLGGVKRSAACRRRQGGTAEDLRGHATRSGVHALLDARGCPRTALEVAGAPSGRDVDLRDNHPSRW